MRPNEFWNCTYREVRLFVESQIKAEERQKKNIISIANNFGDKLIAGLNMAKPKRINLIYDVYDELFAEEIEEERNKNNNQSIAEMVRNLRARR